MNKKLVSLLIVLLILTSSISSFAVSKEEASKWHYGKVSDWAKEELLDAVANGLATNASLFEDCKKDISREEFCNLAVNLYREIKMEDPAPAPISTFSDTSDLSVRIAYKLGIIKGVGDGKFAPENSITREQMGVIMLNTVNALGVEYKAGDGQLSMNDKKEVSSWAVEGVDFVYENDIMKGDGIIFNPKNTTPVEQAVAIANRVYKKYAGEKIPQEAEKPKEEDDYTKGFTASAGENDLQVKFFNTGNIKPIFKYGDTQMTSNGVKLGTNNIKNVKVTDDYKKIYFIDGEERLTSFDTKTKDYLSFGYDLGSVYDYILVQKGKYKGYYIIKHEKSQEGYTVYDNNLLSVGTAYDINYYNLDQAIDEAYRFKFNVNGKDYYNFGTYGGSWDRGKTLRMRPDKASEGPMALVQNVWQEPILHDNNGSYSVKLKFNNEEKSNAGIVFNVTRAKVGNDMYTGYYVGIDPQNNSLQIGWANNKWNQLKSSKIGFDIKAGETYDLQVDHFGEYADVYLNGEKILSAETFHLNVKGYVGVRGWKADVTYESFYAY